MMLAQVASNAAPLKRAAFEAVHYNNVRGRIDVVRNPLLTDSIVRGSIS